MKKAITLTLIFALLTLLAVSCTPKNGENEDSNDDSGNSNHYGPPTPHSDVNDDGEIDGEAPVAENIFFLTGEVKEISGGILIDVTEGEYARGPYWILISSETSIYNANGEEITVDCIKIGDTVRVTYSGQVMMSYPPQVSAIEVKVQ